MYCISAFFSLSTLFSPIIQSGTSDVNLPYASSMGSVRLGTRKKYDTLCMGAAKMQTRSAAL